MLAVATLMKYIHCQDSFLGIKTHSMSCGPKKRGTRKRSEYNDRNNEVAFVILVETLDFLIM